MAIQRIELTEWLPDQPGLTGALTDAKNVVSQQVGYGPFPSAVNFSEAASDNLISVYGAREPNGDTELFTASLANIYSVSGVGVLTNVSYLTGTYDQSGTTTLTVTSNGHKLKTGDSVYLDFTSGTATDGQFTVTVTDANTFTVTTTSATTTGNVTIKPSSSGYTTASNERFRFTQFGDVVIATNNSQRLQSWTLGTSTAFRNLSDDAPIAKFITVVRDFVVCANVKESGTQQQYRVQWSGLNDETTWTSSQVTQSDYQDLPDGGQIVGIRGGEFGVIFLERAIYRMSYIGTPFVFQFDNISRNKGCSVAGSIAQYAGITFYLSDDGFYMCDGQQVIPIGTEKVDRWFFANAAASDFPNMSAAVDPLRKLVLWNFLAIDGTRKLIIYNFATKKWTYAIAGSSYISEATTAALTLDQIDSISASIDALDQSLDSPLFLGGKYFLGGTLDTRVITYTGTYLTGNIQTGDIGSQRSVITLVRPQIDNGSASISVASRQQLDDEIVYGTAVQASSENRVSLRSGGNYHRIQITPTGNNWKNAVAVDIDVVGQGVR